MLKKEEIYIKEIMGKTEPAVVSQEELAEFQRATHCHICEEELVTEKYLDHCHITGKYRGAAHNICNLHFNFSNISYIPCVMHNLKNFDSHLVLSGLKSNSDEVTCIPSNMERYISFSIGDIRFIDSYQFMSSSLENLVANLREKDIDNFKIMKTWMPLDKLHLLLQKGVYPYSYIDNFKKFTEQKLPSKDKFYNDLTKTHLSEEDYKHAKSVWSSFNMKSLGDYHDLYLLCDTLLLADVFENFRNMCLSYYKLDPVHYYGAPGLAWDSCLKMTKVKLQLLTDIDQYLFIEKGIRGGVSMITKRWAESNNKYLPNFDFRKASNFLLIYDVNNLYGWSMRKKLPTGNFRWLSEEEINQIDLKSIGSNTSDKGYIFEVDFYYPPYLHDEQNDFPLAPEKMKVSYDSLSPYSQNILESLGLQHYSTEKLIPNLNNKLNYVVHETNLGLYQELGLEVLKIHRVLEFDQSDWLKPFIDFNTEKRKLATSTFESDFFKLFNNATFGKTMENLRKRINVKLVSDKHKMKKLIAKPEFHSFKIFTENLAGIHLKKQASL